MAATPPKPPVKKDNIGTLKEIINALEKYETEDKCQILETVIEWYKLKNDIEIS